MTIHEHLIRARQDDARRAGERDRLLLEARRASVTRRRPKIPWPACLRTARRLARRIVVATPRTP